MNEEQAMEFLLWWDVIGSGIVQRKEEEPEDHACRLAYRAYCAAILHNSADESSEVDLDATD